MSVNKLWPLILVNLRVLIPNLNVTKLENPQFLRNLRFLAFSGKIARPENPWFLGGLQNQKRPIPLDRALQNEQKNVLHQNLNFPRSKDIGDFVVKKRWKIGNFPTICIIYAKLKHFFDHKVAHIFWSRKVGTLM